jgi:Domain of unknown function (DUF4410)
MHALSRAAPWVLVLLVSAGCASTEVTDRETYAGAKLARPDRIIVYDFAVTPNEVPAGSTLSSAPPEATTPQTEKDIEEGRKLAAEVATRLVADLQEMGLPAVRAEGQPPPRVNDIAIKGSFVTVQEGSTGKRLLIGFGSGGSELQTVVEGYQMTPQGLRKLGGGKVNSGGNKTPGLIVPLAVTAATANPLGLIVVGGMKAYGEVSGSSEIEGRAKATADEIAAQLKTAAEKQGWI